MIRWQRIGIFHSPLMFHRTANFMLYLLNCNFLQEISKPEILKLQCSSLIPFFSAPRGEGKGKEATCSPGSHHFWGAGAVFYLHKKKQHLGCARNLADASTGLNNMWRIRKLCEPFLVCNCITKWVIIFFSHSPHIGEP